MSAYVVRLVRFITVLLHKIDTTDSIAPDQERAVKEVWVGHEWFQG